MVSSYIEFTAFGVYCNDFINHLVSSNHQVWGIASNSDIYTVRTSPMNYKAIAATARQYRVKTKVVHRSGLYFSIRRYRNRIGIPLGLLTSFAVIVLMSNFVWDIRITGLSEESQLGKWQILEQLDKSGIRPGVHINGYNANQAELEIALAVDELAWVSIERAGSRINVKVSERLETQREEITLETPCHVIAAKSGQLVKAEVYRGLLLYEVGSGVHEGDVIVSGKVDGNTLHADAKLFVEVVEAVDFYQPYTTQQRAKNGKSRHNSSVVFLGKRFGGEIEVAKNADHISYSQTITAPKLLGFPLPLRVLNQDYIFYDRIEVTDSAADTREKLDKKIELYESNFLKDSEILEKQAEYFPDDNGIGVLVRYVYRADVALKQVIVDS